MTITLQNYTPFSQYSFQVSKSFNEFITNSARLIYHIDLFISGFEDSNLDPTYNLQDRRNILSAAQNIWRGTGSVALLETLQLSNLEYWPHQDPILLCRSAVTDDAVTFDISQISSRHDDTNGVLSHWQVRLQKAAECSIACIDAFQDLLILRYHGHSTDRHSRSYSGQHYRLSPHSLRTGEPHPRAKQHRIEFEISQRVMQNPHLTCVQVVDNTLAVNMASRYQLLTEMALFDWTSGQKGVSLLMTLESRAGLTSCIGFLFS